MRTEKEAIVPGDGIVGRTPQKHPTGFWVKPNKRHKSSIGIKEGSHGRENLALNAVNFLGYEEDDAVTGK